MPAPGTRGRGVRQHPQVGDDQLRPAPRPRRSRPAEAAAGSCDLLLAVETSLSVYPAAGLVPLADRHGTTVVIVNAEPTPFDDVAVVVVRTPIGDVLPALVTPTLVDGPTRSTGQPLG